jgi:hypothetical protein
MAEETDQASANEDDEEIEHEQYIDVPDSEELDEDALDSDEIAFVVEGT